MNKLLSLLTVAAILVSANASVFAQKTRSAVSEKKAASPSRPVKPIAADAPTRISSINAYSDGRGVYVAWRAEVETGNAGFRLYRVAGKDAVLVGGLVAGAGLTSTLPSVSGTSYDAFDVAGSAADTYFIETLGLKGERAKFGPFGVKSVADLREVAGQSSADLACLQLTKASGESAAPVVPTDLAAERSANALDPDINMQRWVAAQPGVKIGVKQEGMYRVTRAELQAGGFDVNSPSANWQLYVDGVEQSIIVAPDDSYIEFYGRAIDTPEAGVRIYYLLAGATAGKRIEDLYMRPLGGRVGASSYVQSFVRKDRALYISSGVLNGDGENYFGNSVIVGNATVGNPGTAVNTTINLTAVDFSSPTATVEISFQGVNAVPHSIVPKINGNALAMASGLGPVNFRGTYEIPTSWLVEGSNALQFQAYSGGTDINLIESIRVDYARRFEAQNNRISFYSTNYRTTAVGNFTSPTVRAFDLTYPDSPSLLTGLNLVDKGEGVYQLEMPAQRGRVIYATADSGLYTAASIIPNVASTLATAAHNAQLVIISHRDYLAQAEDWANYRRGQGITAEVVDVEDIFDEFSYGAQSTPGIKSFLQFAKGNWQTPPAYVLIIGDASYDYRNYENKLFRSFVPTERVDTVYEETGSDEALCDFDDDGVAELAVGRIPARSGAMVTKILGKVQSFEATVADAPARGAVFASDLPNGYDFQALSQRLANQTATMVTKTYINRADADSRSLLMQKLNAGPFFVNYSGHGSAGIWEGNWLTNSDPATFVNAPNYTLYFMLTCLNGYFLRPDADSLGEALLFANGGAVAVWASTGKTTPDIQEVMATRFYNQMTLGEMTRLGDLINDAKRALAGGRDVRLSWVLLGDPMLKVK